MKSLIAWPQKYDRADKKDVGPTVIIIDQFMVEAEYNTPRGPFSGFILRLILNP